MELWLILALLVFAAALGGAALYSSTKARDAERQHPPIGRFIDVDGIRLHYIEEGKGDPVVLIHGNGTMIQDFTVSGLVDRLSERYRVIVFDRPGFLRRRSTSSVWTGLLCSDTPGAPWSRSPSRLPFRLASAGSSSPRATTSRPLGWTYPSCRPQLFR